MSESCGAHHAKRSTLQEVIQTLQPFPINILRCPQASKQMSTGMHLQLKSSCLTFTSRPSSRQRTYFQARLPYPWHRNYMPVRSVRLRMQISSAVRNQEVQVILHRLPSMYRYCGILIICQLGVSGCACKCPPLLAIRRSQSYYIGYRACKDIPKYLNHSQCQMLFLLYSHSSCQQNTFYVTITLDIH